MSFVVFSYNNISKPGGIPRVLKRLISDFGNYGDGSVRFLAHDLNSYYQVQPGKDAGVDQLLPHPRPDSGEILLHVILPWGPYHRIITKMLQARLSGRKLVIWPWGLFCRQQVAANWNGGHTPLWIKRLVVGLVKFVSLRLADGFFVFSHSEIEDSNLDSDKCIILMMGRPATNLMASETINNTENSGYSNDLISYIGRGLWKEKGIDTIVNLAATDFGAPRKFHFFISSKSADFDWHQSKTNASNLIWRTDVMGADLLPWLLRSSAFITVNGNPAPLQAVYEALYTGTPVIVRREAMMDGFRFVFESLGFPDVVHVVTEDDLTTGNIRSPDLTPGERAQIARISRRIMDPTGFSAWFHGWVSAPQFPANYYASVANSITTAEH
jgi:hypothetical protein